VKSQSKTLWGQGAGEKKPGVDSDGDGWGAVGGGNRTGVKAATKGLARQGERVEGGEERRGAKGGDATGGDRET